MDDLTSGWPPWAIPAIMVGVVLLAMLSNRGGGAAAPGVGGITEYQPLPADPNLVQLAGESLNARASAFGQLVQLVGAESVSQIGATRDIQLEQLHAESANLTTQAALQASLASTAAGVTTSLAASDAALRAHLADTAAQEATAQHQSDTQVAIAQDANATQLAIANSNNKSAATVAGIQENTTKAVSKNNTVASVVGSVVGGIAHFFGF